MHYEFTWGEFGLTMATALLIYYLLIAACFKSPEAAPQALAGMGAVQEDEAEISLVSSRELDFAPPADQDKVLLLGRLADFTQELKTLVRITIEAGDSKENFLSLFRLIAAKYGRLPDGAFNRSIAGYVLDSGLPFELTQHELTHLLNDLNDE